MKKKKIIIILSIILLIGIGITSYVLITQSRFTVAMSTSNYKSYKECDITFFHKKPNRLYWIQAGYSTETKNLTIFWEDSWRMDQTVNFSISIIPPVIILNSIICGLISKRIGKQKGYTHGFWWGFIFLIIGIFIQALRPYHISMLKE